MRSYSNTIFTKEKDVVVEEFKKEDGKFWDNYHFKKEEMFEWV